MKRGRLRSSRRPPMPIRLLLALSEVLGSTCLRRFGVVQARTGDRSGAHRSAHGFWQEPTADLPDADHDGIRPRHHALQTSRGQPCLSWIDGGPDRNNSDRCYAKRARFMDKRRLIATRFQEGITHNTGAHQKTAEGLPAAYEGRRNQPHPFHHLPPIPAGSAPQRRCSTRHLKSPDASDGKGNGAYPPTTLDCGTAKHRHPRFGPVI
ncbi:helicase-like protein [Trypanosoma cruzi]|nr:helicase-like protein [Trypanosoma cruzi]